MPYHRLSTAKIARAVGCHPNTVRLYEAWGLLPPVERSRAGYRLYTPVHLNQMRLARLALNTAWPGRAIRRSATALVKLAATGDLGAALENAYRHLALVHAECSQAEAAARLLERWAEGAPTDPTVRTLGMRETAALLGLTRDVLRGWERNGLLAVPRDPANRYRRYGGVEIARLRVIRMLRSSGYSILAILRMLSKLDRGEAGDLRGELDLPANDDDVYSAADRWMATLTAQEQVALQLIALLEERIRTE